MSKVNTEPLSTEEAIVILKSLLNRPRVRANGKSFMTTAIDLALIKAIVALEKEKKDEN